jgi:hypothetical protein
MTMTNGHFTINVDSVGLLHTLLTHSIGYWFQLRHRRQHWKHGINKATIMRLASQGARVEPQP